MSGRHLLPGFLLCVVSCLPCAAVAQSDPAGGGTEVGQLDISAGRWVYHGHFVARKGKPASPWTWHEDCHWSANHAFMLCSFSNTWAGKHVDSVVVDTYNGRDESFWHYEIFDDDPAAGKPFASRMQIDGPTRTESWTETHKGKTLHVRIVYKFASASSVTVLFQESKDGTHWDTTASGTGEKTGA